MNSIEPLVSIIIPIYNRALVISETLDSIIEQDYQKWECIIVDDGSTDDSSEIIQMYIDKDPRFNLYQRPDFYKKGANGARNYGFDLSKGEFIQWFDSDDIMHENMLSEKITILRAYPEYESVISQLYFFEDTIDEIKGQTTFRRPYILFYENTITWNIQVWTQSIMFRKQFLIDTNERFDESLKRLHDYDLFSRIFIKSMKKSYLLEKPLCYIRRNSQDSISTNFFIRKNITELEKSEYIVASKIIGLLINENKFSKNLEKYFYRDHKRRISNLMKTSDNEVFDNFIALVDLYLTYVNKKYKLARFYLGVRLIKIIPVDNIFLIYRRPYIIKNLIQNSKRAYKIILIKGYLASKLKKIFFEKEIPKSQSNI